MTVAQRQVGNVPERINAPAARSVLIAAYGAIAVVGVLDLLTPPEVVLISLTIIGPLVASLRAPSRQTAAVATVALLVAAALGQGMDGYPTVDYVVRLLVVTSAGVLAVSAATQRHHRLAAMHRIAHVAEVAQRVMLRPPPRRLAGLALAARYVSASSDLRVGGDLFETAYTATGVRVVVGDARGKGLDGISLASTVLAAFREAVWEGGLAELACTIDEHVTKEALDDEDFVTAVLIEFLHEGGVDIVNCGHHAPIRIRAGALQALQPSVATTPLGLAPEPRVERFPFVPGDQLLICTDGLIEARDSTGTFFPLEEHLKVLGSADPQAAVDDIVTALIAHVPGAIDDDVAVMLVQREHLVNDLPTHLGF